MQQATSVAAEQMILPYKQTLRDRVLTLLRLSGTGLTDEQIQRCAPMSANTERPRRKELLELGLIEDSGMRRKTLAGRQAIVWRAL